MPSGREQYLQALASLSELTRAYFLKAAGLQTPKIGAAMRAFARNPSDQKAIATLAANAIGKPNTKSSPM